MIIYASDFLNYDNSSYDSPDDDWVIQYAKRANLFDSCKKDLAIGVCVIFLFILIIAVILCFMIWQNVKPLYALAFFFEYLLLCIFSPFAHALHSFSYSLMFTVGITAILPTVLFGRTDECFATAFTHTNLALGMVLFNCPLISQLDVHHVSCEGVPRNIKD